MPSCPVCGFTRYKIIYRLAIGNIAQCVECTLVCLVNLEGTERPRVEYDISYYQSYDDSRPWGYVDYLGADAQIRRWTASAMEQVIRSLHPTARSLLDVGCAAGYLVSTARSQGWEATGIDSSPATAYLASHTGMDGHITNSSLERFALEASGLFDVVTLLDVLEHVANPVEAVEKAMSLVQPKGILVILTPRFGGRLYREQLENYVQFKSDLWYISETSLVRVVEAAGVRTWDMTLMETALQTRAHKVHPEVLRKYERERDSLFLVSRPRR